MLVDDRVALPVPGQPTTHILKPPIARFSGTTENEALVMRPAASVFTCASFTASTVPTSRTSEALPRLLATPTATVGRRVSAVASGSLAALLMMKPATASTTMSPAKDQTVFLPYQA